LEEEDEMKQKGTEDVDSNMGKKFPIKKKKKKKKEVTKVTRHNNYYIILKDD
jgi:hypothetical protein